MITKEFSSGMNGTLSQMPPVELFQTLNYNQKTGTLRLSLSNGPAMVTFRAGRVVAAMYGHLEGKNGLFRYIG